MASMRKAAALAALVAGGAVWMKSREPRGGRPIWLTCPIPADPPERGTLTDEKALRLETGGHRLTIPAGAAPAGTTFHLEVGRESKPTVHITTVPPDLTLSSEAELQMSFARCKLQGNPFSYGIWREEGPDQWRRVGGEAVIGLRRKVKLTRFSTYSLAAN